MDNIHNNVIFVGIWWLRSNPIFSVNCIFLDNEFYIKYSDVIVIVEVWSQYVSLVLYFFFSSSCIIVSFMFTLSSFFLFLSVYFPLRKSYPPPPAIFSHLIKFIIGFIFGTLDSVLLFCFLFPPFFIYLKVGVRGSFSP